jgi:DNA replication and repair protein RecF
MIHSIRLQQFRNYSDDSFEFEPGVNIIVGPNGSGKTNLLEAILTISIGKSYRVRDQDLIQFQKPWARLDANNDGENRTIKLVQESTRAKKSYVFDDKEYKLLTRNHIVPIVLFEPDHLQLLHGQPELRRNFLDDLLEQTVPGFITTRKHYRRVLSQRNALLKSFKKPSKDQLFVWNLRLSELGGSVVKYRMELVESIAKKLPDLYQNIAGSKSTEVTIKYQSKIPHASYETTLLKALEDYYERDIERGFTSLGPHRDDFMILFNDHPASEAASRGEVRTALLALKIYELELLEKTHSKKPILLLDDVFSELDGKRRHALAGFLKDHQTFITTTDADLVLDSQMQNNTVIPISKAM